MSKTILVSIALSVVTCFEIEVRAEHEGYVVCRDSGYEAGDDCDATWGTSVDSELDRERVARAVANALGSGFCIPIPFLPFSCELDFNDTFDVCRTENGPCYRYRYKLGSVLEQVGRERGAPQANDDFWGPQVWGPDTKPNRPVSHTGTVQCNGQVASITTTWGASSTGETPLIFEAERLQSGAWVPYNNGNPGCLLYSTSALYTFFRVRGINYQGASVWQNFVAERDCGGNPF